MNVVIVEDQALFREFLAMMVNDHPDYALAGTASDGEQALEVIRAMKPDLVILDILIPCLSGIRVAQTISREIPTIRILALSSEMDAKTVHQVHKLGIHGFVDKNEASMEVLLEAMGTVGKSRRFYSGSVRKAILRLQVDPNAFQKILSPREQEVLAMIGGGYTDEEIGSLLEISTTTANSHRRGLFHKLDIHTTPELILFAHENGFWKADFRKMSLEGNYHVPG